MGHLVFVGDSYCAAYARPNINTDRIMHIQAKDSTYLDLSADLLGTEFFCFGYPGRSWWFSRSRLLKLLNSPDCRTFLHYTDAFIFCHTDANRLNTSNPKVSTVLLNPDPNRKSGIDFDPDLSMPYKLWTATLVDGEFQSWAMEKWFQEINELFGSKPMIHFNCAPFTVEISKQLQGVVYTTPLLHISLGEIVGTDEDVSESLVDDKRYNHFNKHNQSAMARLIADTLKNYQPGCREIDLIKYDFDQPNPNAHRWPNPGFGTR